LGIIKKECSLYKASATLAIVDNFQQIIRQQRTWIKIAQFFKKTVSYVQYIRFLNYYISIASKHALFTWTIYTCASQLEKNTILIWLNDAFCNSDMLRQVLKWLWSSDILNWSWYNQISGLHKLFTVSEKKTKRVNTYKLCKK